MENAGLRKVIVYRYHVRSKSVGSIHYVIPVFNDWQSLGTLVENLYATIAKYFPEAESHLIIVDDGSTITNPIDFAEYPAFTSTTLLELDRNVGHQMAIHEGLSFAISENGPGTPEVMVIMDGDGEDPPEAVPEMVLAWQKNRDKIVVAKRVSRQEGLWFRIGYRIHRFLFRVATGYSLDFGNFMVLSRASLLKMIPIIATNGHIASSALSFDSAPVRVPVPKSKRLSGRSRMNAESLVGLSLLSLSVHQERILARILMATSAITVIAVPTAIGIVSWRLVSDDLTPGWASIVLGFLVVLSVQFWVFLGLGTIVAMNQKAIMRSQIARPEATIRSLSPNPGK